jgi:hypothetical protein
MKKRLGLGIRIRQTGLAITVAGNICMVPQKVKSD